MTHSPPVILPGISPSDLNLSPRENPVPKAGEV